NRLGNGKCCRISGGRATAGAESVLMVWTKARSRSFAEVKFDTDARWRTRQPCGSTDEKKPGITRALLRQQVESACDLNQVSHLLDGTPAVGPFDVSLITRDGLDHSVSTFQNAEAADQIDLG